jgi:hypothetical protein
MRQLTPDRCRPAVNLGLAIILRESLSGSTSLLFSLSPEGGIERSLFDQRCFTALPAERFVMAYPGGGAKPGHSDRGLEDEKIQADTQRFAFGNIHSFPELSREESHCSPSTSPVHAKGEFRKIFAPMNLLAFASYTVSDFMEMLE